MGAALTNQQHRMTIKAIPTRYKGHHFRSRLEARYAVFLDTLGAQWQYEPEGFQLPITGPYLPDFWVEGFPARRMSGEESLVSFWLEIKPDKPRSSDFSFAKLRELCVSTGRYGYVGTPADFDQVIKDCDRDSSWHDVLPSGFSMGMFRSGVAKPYETFMIESGGSWWDVFTADLAEENRLIDLAPLAGEWDARRWLLAVEAARSARFEHGAKGAT